MGISFGLNKCRGCRLSYSCILFYNYEKEQKTDRLMNAFNNAVQQIELTDAEEELAEAIAEEMDKNYNLSKKN